MFGETLYLPVENLPENLPNKIAEFQPVSVDSFSKKLFEYKENFNQNSNFQKFSRLSEKISSSDSLVNITSKSAFDPELRVSHLTCQISNFQAFSSKNVKNVTFSQNKLIADLYQEQVEESEAEFHQKSPKFTSLFGQKYPKLPNLKYSSKSADSHNLLISLETKIASRKNRNFWPTQEIPDSQEYDFKAKLDPNTIFNEREIVAMIESDSEDENLSFGNHSFSKQVSQEESLTDGDFDLSLCDLEIWPLRPERALIFLSEIFVFFA